MFDEWRMPTFSHDRCKNVAGCGGVSLVIIADNSSKTTPPMVLGFVREGDMHKRDK